MENNELPDVYVDQECIHFRSEPPCGKHLTDDVIEDIEAFIYVENVADVTCPSCLIFIKSNLS